MKKIAWGLIVVVAAGIAAVGLTRTMAKPKADSPGGRDIVRVARGDLETVVKATGVVKPRIGAEVRVGSRTSGVVRRLYVRVGDAVAKGQLLAELDDRELTARHGDATAAVSLSQANLDYARADLRRAHELGAAGLIAQSDLERAERAAAVAEQQRTQARATLDLATTQLGYARIVAPITGVVSSVSTQEGETVTASFATPTFVTLLDLTRLEVWAYVDETDIGRVQTGQRAQFTVDTYADRNFDGRVTTVYPQADIRDNVVNYVTVVRFDPTRDHVLRPEMTTSVRIAVATRSGVLTVPLRAVRREGGRPFVWRLEGGAPEQRWITTGGRNDSDCEVVDGLREGDTVVMGDQMPERGGNS